MKSSLTRTRWAAIGAAIAVTFGGGAVFIASAATTGTVSGQFWAISPCRLLDTRSDVAPIETSKIENLGIRKGAVQSKTEGNKVNNDITVIFDAAAVSGGSNTFTLQYSLNTFRPIMGACDDEFSLNGDFEDLTGGSADVPTALLLNVTTVSMTSSGFVTVYPWAALSGSGTGATGRPTYSNLNPISGLPSVSNNVTVRLGTTASSTYIPGVKCGSGTHSVDPESDGTYTGSDCNGLKAFRVYNENGSTHVIIDVLGYYTDESDLN